MSFVPFASVVSVVAVVVLVVDAVVAASVAVACNLVVVAVANLAYVANVAAARAIAGDDLLLHLVLLLSEFWMELLLPVTRLGLSLTRWEPLLAQHHPLADY